MDAADTASAWPHRLLHVPSLTSFVRQPGHIYGTYRQPRYNVLSYTWGRFEQKGKPSLNIFGVDWPIPSIRPSHFTEKEFLAVIEEAAKGVSFLWLDVACIPQHHEHETPEARRIRDQEIGRQGLIFSGATRAFAWLNKISEAQLGHCASELESLKWTDYESFTETTNPEELRYWLSVYEGRLACVTEAMDKITEDHYFSSLWTLQEAMLRRDAVLLSKEGRCTYLEHKRDEDQSRHAFLIEGDETIGDFAKFRIRVVESGKNPSVPDKAEVLTPSVPEKAEELTLSRLAIACSSSFGALVVTSWEMESSHALDAAALLDVNLEPGSSQSYSHRTKRFANTVLQAQEQASKRGLLHVATRLSPNAAYSAASHRKVTQYLDRIYGVEQVYGIACSRSPTGATKEDKLANLSLELAQKLVTMSPFLSQLFIHSAPLRNPRTWEITQLCEVPWYMDKFEYEQDNSPTDLCHMEVMDDGNTLYMKGLSCRFTDFLRPYVPEHANDTYRLRDFCIFTPDHHVDRALFTASAQGTVRFQTYQTMSIYTRGSPESPAFQADPDNWSIYSYNAENLQVMLLGMYKSETPPKAVTSATTQYFYGLVLAASNTGDSESLQTWDRIGILTWIEEIDIFDMDLDFQDFEGYLH